MEIKSLIKALFGLQLFLLFIALTPVQQARSQTNDTIQRALNEQITSQIERIAENLDEGFDYTELLDAYNFYVENKVNINSKEIEGLINIYIISAFQFENLRVYQKKHGKLLSLNELEFIEGFDEQTIALLLPIVSIEEEQRYQRINPKNVLKWGKQQVFMRLETNLNAQEGYKSISDSALLAKPNARYLGSREKLYTRYGFNYRNKVRAGFTLEKDAGEVFLVQNVHDSIRRLLGKKLRNGFDFNSLHLFIADMGVVKALAIGDYHLEFGQGLTMWSGLAFGKSTEPTNVMKYGMGVKPNTSVNENFYMRGGAVTLGWKRIDLTGFYSDKYLDANVNTTDTSSNEDFTISSLQESGLHRTVSELLDKGTVRQRVYGARAGFKSSKLELGYTIHHTKLGAILSPRLYPYSQFRFNAKELSNQGIDFRLVLPQTIFFGELSRSNNGGIAGIAGITAQPAGFVSLTLAYRNYEKNYQNLFSNAFSEGSATNNEKGIYAGIVAGLAPGWKMSAYADFFTFPWLRYQTDAPSYGYDYYIQLDHRISRRADAYFRFRTKMKMTNDRNPWNFVDHINPYYKNTYRFHLNYGAGRSFMLKNRAEIIYYNEKSKPKSFGYIVYQDILFRPEGKPYELTFRYAMFDTDTYDSRVYTYEYDVLYAFSIPSFYEKGTRMYLMLRLKAHKSLDVWARIANTWYADRTIISSGLDLINGKSKTDFKLQLRYKF